MKRACPALTIRAQRLRGAGTPGQRFEATAPTGARLGTLFTEEPPNAAIMVGGVHVLPMYRGCGVATKLYEAAAAWACREGRPLRSDEARTAMTQSFWAKQVARKRAVCAEPGIQLERDAPPTEAIFGRGGCAYYQLTAPCPAPTLEGPRRRRVIGRITLAPYSRSSARISRSDISAKHRSLVAVANVCCWTAVRNAPPPRPQFSFVARRAIVATYTTDDRRRDQDLIACRLWP